MAVTDKRSPPADCRGSGSGAFGASCENESITSLELGAAAAVLSGRINAEGSRAMVLAWYDSVTTDRGIRNPVRPPDSVACVVSPIAVIAWRTVDWHGIVNAELEGRATGFSTPGSLLDGRSAGVLALLFLWRKAVASRACGRLIDEPSSSHSRSDC